MPLRLRPDDLWLSVLTAFGAHVDKDAEKYRKDFVQHDVVMELCARVPPEWEADDDLVDWDVVVAQVSAAIVHNIRATGVNGTFLW